MRGWPGRAGTAHGQAGGSRDAGTHSSWWHQAGLVPLAPAHPSGVLGCSRPAPPLGLVPSAVTQGLQRSPEGSQQENRAARPRSGPAPARLPRLGYVELRPPAFSKQPPRQTTRTCKQPHAPPPRRSRGHAQGLRPPSLARPGYLRTPCSDTLTLRHRKASAAGLPLHSSTGGEWVKPGLGARAILRLPGEEGSPQPQRAQLPERGSSHGR